MRGDGGGEGGEVQEVGGSRGWWIKCIYLPDRFLCLVTSPNSRARQHTMEAQPACCRLDSTRRRVSDGLRVLSERARERERACVRGRERTRAYADLCCRNLCVRACVRVCGCAGVRTCVRVCMLECFCKGRRTHSSFGTETPPFDGIPALDTKTSIGPRLNSADTISRLSDASELQSTLHALPIASPVFGSINDFATAWADAMSMSATMTAAAPSL